MLRVWGPRALEVADAVFRPHRGARLAETRRGRVAARPDRPRDSATRWSSLCSRAIPRPSRSSATEEPRPSPWSSKPCKQPEPRSLDGARLAEHLSDDPFAHDALADLARAPTVLTAEILLDQAQGALRGELMRLGHSIADDRRSRPG